MSETGDRRAPYSTAGFTLVEALVVVAITGLIGGLMFPRLQAAIDGLEFRLARSALLLGVREARALAIRSGEPAVFRIARDATGFRIGNQPPHVLPKTVALTSRSGNGTVTFFNDGTSDGGRLSLVAADVRQDFIVFPTTGLIVQARQ